MKKRIASVLFAVLLGAAAMPVYAAGNTEGQDTLINAKVNSTYMLTVPAETAIAFGSKSTNLKGTLKVAGNVDVGEKVTVTAAPNALQNDTHKESLPYTLMNGEAVFTTMDWSEQELRAGLNGSAKEIQLSVAITNEAWAAAKAGSYAGSITFKAELK